jgi:hypothetical protein
MQTICIVDILSPSTNEPRMIQLVFMLKYVIVHFEGKEIGVGFGVKLGTSTQLDITNAKCHHMWRIAGANQHVHWFLGGKGLGIQQRTSVWDGLPKFVAHGSFANA